MSTQKNTHVKLLLEGLRRSRSKPEVPLWILSILKHESFLSSCFSRGLFFFSLVLFGLHRIHILVLDEAFALCR